VNVRTSILFLCGALVIGALVHCGGGSSPTQPPSTVPTVPVTTTTTAPTAIVLPAGMVCDPTPPPLYRMLPQQWRQRGNGWILDSKPQVMNVDNYCQRIGESGRFCDTRPEGDPQRTACDYLAVGQASDTGRWGPTWTIDGRPCDAPGTTGGSNPCVNDSENQFKALAKGSGLYEACASRLAKADPTEGSLCGQVEVQ
jgi:hypothetical protein